MTAAFYTSSDLDERSVADTLGWPLGTLKTRLHRARAQLRDKLGEDLKMAVPTEEPAR